MPINSTNESGAVANSAREKENSKDDRIVDSLQALVEICLEKGSFSKAKSCADKALQIYDQERLPQDNELAKIYTARAWSNLQLGEKTSALTDVRQAMDLSEKAHALPEQAEAEGVQSVIYLQSGNKLAAKECYGRVCQMLSSGVRRKPILADAMKKYNQETAKK
jgi:tetratricopeptide (TPR) repeat protein